MSDFKYHKCKPHELNLIAKDIVHKATDLALFLIKLDERHRFIYKLPIKYVDHNFTLNKFLNIYENKEVKLMEKTKGDDSKTIIVTKQLNIESVETRDSTCTSSLIKNIISDVMPSEKNLDNISGTIPDSLENIYSFYTVEAPEKEMLRLKKSQQKEEEIDEKKEEEKKQKEIETEEGNEKEERILKNVIEGDKHSTITFCSTDSAHFEIVDYNSDHYEDSRNNRKYADVETVSSTPSTQSQKYQPHEIDWIKIMEFQKNEALENLSKYISSWHLSERTKWSIINVEQVKDVPLLGKTYFADVYFSKPMNFCPNPLAIAKVQFAFHVSHILPKYYPIMVTYQFEGYKNMFYALGNLCTRSADFQRHYIDQIIIEKMRVYAALAHVSNNIEKKEPYPPKK